MTSAAERVLKLRELRELRHGSWNRSRHSEIVESKRYKIRSALLQSFGENPLDKSKADLS
jgi:hypothetical protein